MGESGGQVGVKTRVVESGIVIAVCERGKWVVKDGG